MADTFSVVTQYPTLEFLGGTQTQDVMAVGYRTKAHGVYFEVRIPRKLYSAAIVHDYGIGYTGTVEQFFANPNVIGGEWTQTPTAAGELQDNMVYTVSSDSGNSTGQVTFAFGNLITGTVNKAIDNLVTTLNDAENS
jgi:hypothetical protein